MGTTKNNGNTKNKTRTVEVRGHRGHVRTVDNPLNKWVRAIDDGKFYRTK